MLNRLLIIGTLTFATLFAPVSSGVTSHLLADDAALFTADVSASGVVTDGACLPPVEASDSVTITDGAIHPPVETAPIDA